jgi:serine/threonine protein kinase
MAAQSWQHLKSLFGRGPEREAERNSPQLCDHASPAEVSAGERLTVTAAARLAPALETALQARFFSDGEVVLGRFEILRFLDCGGMGEVYEANDCEMGRIALKTIRQDISSNPLALERLKREAQLARTISSPHVCRIYEIFLVPPGDGRPPAAFITMEFLEGRTLAEYIRQNGPLPWREAEALALQICRGLEAIHQAGIVHRDLKTGNIMLVEAGTLRRAVVMDFGLARRALTMGAAAHSAITQEGSILGTPEYMAPEQLEGGEVTAAADIYALGIVLYEMAAGRHPFEASSPIAAVVRRARQLEPLSQIRPQIPRRWDRVIDQCLQYDPLRRFQTPGEVASALAPSTLQKLLNPASAVASQTRLRRWVPAVAATLLAVAGLLWNFLPGHYRPSTDALHWYQEGVESLHEGTYVKAGRALEQALASDKDFALAHARLAQTWAEQEFSGRAEHELLAASSPEVLGRLSHLDREYFEATRAEVAGDWKAAVGEYRRILGSLGSKDKAAGYIDLGRAEEGSGDIRAAIRDYGRAAAMLAESPAPFMRLAILEERQGETGAAAQAFARAESLYRAESNYEGLAEVAYQRGYGASKRGRLGEAREFTEQSLEAARAISSGQLEIRAITQLGVIAYSEGKDKEAIRLTTQAVEMARDDGLDYWAIDARIRRANAYADLGAYGAASADLQAASGLAKGAGIPRLQALANWSLAVICDQQGQAAATVSYAEPAFEYYRQHGFLNESIHTLTLIGRAQLAEGDPQGAADSVSQALGLSATTGNPATLYQIEELAANVELDREHYPEALRHARRALNASRLAGLGSEYELLRCASAEWRLGLYGEARASLEAIEAQPKKQKVVAYQWNRAKAEMLFSLGELPEAYRYGRAAMALAQELSNSSRFEAARLLAVISLHLGDRRGAAALAKQASELAARQNNAEQLAEANLAVAEVTLNRHLAQSAYNFFAKAGKMESQWRALLCLATICSRAGDATSAKRFSAKGLDVFSDLEHNLLTSTFATYWKRYDVAAARKQFEQLGRF